MPSGILRSPEMPAGAEAGSLGRTGLVVGSTEVPSSTAGRRVQRILRRFALGGRSIVAVAVAIAGLSGWHTGWATAAPGLTPADSGAPAGIDGPDADTREILLAQPPPGWSVTTSVHTPGLRIAEYANPEGLEPDHIDTLRFEATTTRPFPDPLEFLDGLQRDLGARCEGHVVLPVTSGYENGYPMAIELQLCRRQHDSGRGIIRLIKVIEGDAQLHVISRSRSATPFAPGQEPITTATMAEWSQWLATVTLCNRDDSAHPCLPPRAGPDSDPRP